MNCLAIGRRPRWPAAPPWRRAFFTLPDFPSWSSSRDIKTYHERKVLPYTQEELYGIVADVASYNRFIPFCIGSRIVREVEAIDRRILVMDAELTVGFLAFQESYVSRVRCEPHHFVQAVASSSTPLFKTLTTTWRFQPMLNSPQSYYQLSPASTLVTLDLAYAFANPVHASVSSAFFGQVSGLMVKAFEERCLEVHGRRPSS